MTDDFERKRFAWARSGFDMVGIVGAIAAWLVGLLLGVVWDPLFWIGAAAAVLFLLATRRSTRTPPADPDAVVSPVDGVVVSAVQTSPPSELRLPGGDWTRLRISSSPASISGVYAPMAGEVASVISEAGEPSVAIAMDADAHGLAAAYVNLASGERQMGLRLATGGLGPRLEMEVEAGDAVRIGRKLGLRRAGGWCDVYLPAGVELVVEPGMTVVAAETRLTEAALPGDPAAVTPPLSEAADAASDEVQTDETGNDPAAGAGGAGAAAAMNLDPLVPAPVKDDSAPEALAETDASDELEIETETQTEAEVPEAPAAPDEPPDEDTPEKTDDTAAVEDESSDEEEDPSEMFARLRSKVEEAAKKDK